MKKILLAIVLVLAAVKGAHAQTTTPCPSPCTLLEGKQFTLLADYTPDPNATGFRIYMDDVKFGTDLSLNALSNGTVTVSGLVVARGTHKFSLVAFGPAGESEKSNEVTIVGLQPPPNPLKNLRILTITVTVENGQLKFQFAGVPEDGQ